MKPLRLGIISNRIKHTYKQHHTIVKYFTNLGSTRRSDARRTNENKSKIVMAKAGFNKKDILLNDKSELNLRKKFVNC
jgi:hypothetical protein